MAEIPAQVRLAVALLWVALVITIADSALAVAASDVEDRGFLLWMTFGLAAFFAVNALLIHLTSRRRNWARILLLLLTLGLLSPYGIWPPDFAAEPLSEWIPAFVSTLLEVAAMIMLFSGKGARWYSMGLDSHGR